MQTVTLLDVIEQHRFGAVLGGGRRDQERARAKERVFTERDELGQWDPKNQRPELWNLYYAHRRLVFRSDGMLMAVSPFLAAQPDEDVYETTVRFRTAGDTI